LIYGTVVPNDAAPDATDAQYFDNFTVHNRFYGGQVGLSTEGRWGLFFLDADGRMGLGVMEQEARVSGGTLLRSADGTPASFDGGVLAQPGNEGTFTQGRFAVALELGLRGGYEFTPNVRAVVGCDYLFLSQVARPAGLIGPVASAQVPQLHVPGATTAAGPSPAIPSSGFSAEGLTCGLEIRY
jgi:hypothetical protein